MQIFPSLSSISGPLTPRPIALSFFLNICRNAPPFVQVYQQCVFGKRENGRRKQGGIQGRLRFDAGLERCVVRGNAATLRASTTTVAVFRTEARTLFALWVTQTGLTIARKRCAGTCIPYGQTVGVGCLAYRSNAVALSLQLAQRTRRTLALEQA